MQYIMIMNYINRSIMHYAVGTSHTHITHTHDIDQAWTTGYWINRPFNGTRCHHWFRAVDPRITNSINMSWLLFNSPTGHSEKSDTNTLMCRTVYELLQPSSFNACLTKEVTKRSTGFDISRRISYSHSTDVLALSLYRISRTATILVFKQGSCFLTS